MNDTFSTNKILVEVTVHTQFGHQDAVALVKRQLSCPAVSAVEVRNVETNFRLHDSPSDTLQKVEVNDYNKRVS